MPTNLELLRQIQDGAVSSEMPVSELLRRSLVLAKRLNLPELGDWVRYELDGYPAQVELPDYRVMSGIARGHFLGAFGRVIRFATLPARNLPKEYRDWGRRAYFRQPIVALEKVASDQENATVQVTWPGDLIARVQGDFYEGMALAQAWLDVSRSDFVSAVETVRNRILSFALEAEAFVDPAEDQSPTTAAELSNVFHTHIYGSVGNLAQGSANVTQSAGVAPGDLAGLLGELRCLGVPDADLRELRPAIEEDGVPPSGKLGRRVADWLGRMVGKAMSGAWQVSRETATVVLPKVLEKYYGLGQ